MQSIGSVIIICRNESQDFNKLNNWIHTQCLVCVCVVSCMYSERRTFTACSICVLCSAPNKTQHPIFGYSFEWITLQKQICSVAGYETLICIHIQYPWHEYYCVDYLSFWLRCVHCQDTRSVSPLSTQLLTAWDHGAHVREIMKQ
jgi:hypothetical protein